jgi:hypothetical protein
VATDHDGIPIGWAAAGANRHGHKLLDPTLAELVRRGLLEDVETAHLDRGYGADTVRQLMAGYGISDVVNARRRATGSAKAKVPGAARTAFGRSSGPTPGSPTSDSSAATPTAKVAHGLAQFALAVVFMITDKLIDWRDGWSPGCVAIR